MPSGVQRVAIALLVITLVAPACTQESRDQARQALSGATGRVTSRPEVPTGAVGETDRGTGGTANRGPSTGATGVTEGNGATARTGATGSTEGGQPAGGIGSPSIML